MNGTQKFNPKLGPPPRSRRQEALAQWRGIDLEPAERACAQNTKSIAKTMPGVLADLGLDRRRAELEILKVWNQLLDPNIVAHAQPVGLHKGTLFVKVDSNVWLDEIVRYRRKEILASIQHSFGPDLVSRISFRLG